MWKNDTFNEVTNFLLNHQLGKAAQWLDNYFQTHPGHPSTQSYRLYSSHYELLVSYWLLGYADPQREKLYTDLLHHFYVLVAEMQQHECNENTPFRASIKRDVATFNRTIANIRDELEGYVSDLALVSLEPENVQSQHRAEIYEQHQKRMSMLFNEIWISDLWNDTEAKSYKELLLSPTVDSLDQQLLISAITLAALNVFDIHKFRILSEIYQQTTDEKVRQRALVGWVMVADSNMAQLYPEIGTIIHHLCQYERCCHELLELQMQMAYCVDAENDTRLIQDEIMPDLLNHSNLKITRQGIIETEEDSLEDILHPDLAEQNLEKMEESMKKMADMQKQGADIYFSGFSQMKRFSFFQDLSNWFVPFYPQHPGIYQTWTQAKGRRFLHMITKIGAFCDSDKYSFVLAFEQVFNRLPQNMLNMIEQGDAMPIPVGGKIADEEQQKPAFIRRVYLQNLYRFFKIYPRRGEFRNPFGDKTNKAYLFFTNPLFCSTALQHHFVQMASFLMKRKLEKAALMVLQSCDEKERNFQYYIMMGTLAQRASKNDIAADYFHSAVKCEPTNLRALSGWARSLFLSLNYTSALSAYEQLLLIQENNLNYELGRVACLINLERQEEALPILYRLDYNHPNHQQIMGSLAWALTLCNKWEQADIVYKKLNVDTNCDPANLLNYCYNLWFQHQNQQALNSFRRLKKEHAYDFEYEFTQVEAEHIKEHGISQIEIQLMLDQINRC